MADAGTTTSIHKARLYEGLANKQPISGAEKPHGKRACGHLEVSLKTLSLKLYVLVNGC